ncbi:MULTISPECIES: hypothetical protein [Cysteiniphilum]|uniref:Uncharacterized protein n=1 Tax=Cysteiniphilum litorale TaxID=2056700 RepID=A0A8J2Z2Y6_9GAMM|nr:MULTISPECIES: hypothetical protein [Cysteiniphilum]GGF88914.1 hypothetical protein GCM10010995_02720 [Cysteiniphilum litorale]
MANQYSTISFADSIKVVYQVDVNEALEKIKASQLSYQELANQLGFKESTVRKWFAKYKIKLVPYKVSCKYPSIHIKQRLKKEINADNFLYKPWH